MYLHFARLASAAVIVAFGLVRAFAPASAQLNGTLTIFNNTSCPMEVCTANGAACGLIAPGSRTIPVPCATTAIGVRVCGALRVLQLRECVDNANVGNGCCAGICFVPGFVGCTFILTIDPATGPCACP